VTRAVTRVAGGRRTPRRVADALTALALVLGVGGAAAWLWPARERVAPLAPEIPAPPPAARDVAPDPTRALRVASRNPFAATREAPRTRFVPADAFDPMAAVTTAEPLPGLLPDPTVQLPGDPPVRPTSPAADAPGAEQSTPESPADAAAARARDRRAPALFGTVMGGDVPRALLRLDARVPGAQLYAEGARAGGWRVVRVEADRVTLAGQGRTVTLRLPRVAPP
jgi:hypothetical protein